MGGGGRELKVIQKFRCDNQEKEKSFGHQKRKGRVRSVLKRWGR